MASSSDWETTDDECSEQRAPEATDAAPAADRDAVVEPVAAVPGEEGEGEGGRACPNCSSAIGTEELVPSEAEWTGGPAYAEGWVCDGCGKCFGGKDVTTPVLRHFCLDCGLDLCEPCLAPLASMMAAGINVTVQPGRFAPEGESEDSGEGDEGVEEVVDEAELAARREATAEMLLNKALEFLEPVDAAANVNELSAEQMRHGVIAITLLREAMDYVPDKADLSFHLGKQFLSGRVLPQAHRHGQFFMRRALALGMEEAAHYLDANSGQRGGQRQEQEPAQLRNQIAAGVAEQNGKAIHDASEGLCSLGYKMEHVTGHLKAAALGYGPSMNMLGYAYHYGVGVIAAGEKAFEWYSKGAEAGDVEAKVNVGVCYVDGIGVERDTAKALPLYREAAAAGNVMGYNNLAYLLKRGGDWGPPDPEGAFQCYLRAAEHPDAHAQTHINLAELYWNAVGTERNEVEAFKWALTASFDGKKTWNRLIERVAQAAINCDARCECELHLTNTGKAHPGFTMGCEDHPWECATQ